MGEDKSRRSGLSDADEEASFSSPPCFIHELRPEYLGYLSEAETADLLADATALQAIAGADAEIARRLLCRRLRECLLRIYPSAVPDELEELLHRLEVETR